jgi:hypothetical protein
MYLKFFIPLFLIATFNYNFTLLRKDFHMKYRLLTWFVLQWGGRILVGALLAFGFLLIRGKAISELNTRQAADLFFILLVLNIIWTMYERKRDQRTYCLKGYYYRHEE